MSLTPAQLHYNCILIFKENLSSLQRDENNTLHKVPGWFDWLPSWNTRKWDSSLKLEIPVSSQRFSDNVPAIVATINAIGVELLLCRGSDSQFLIPYDYLGIRYNHEVIQILSEKPELKSNKDIQIALDAVSKIRERFKKGDPGLRHEILNIKIS